MIVRIMFYMTAFHLATDLVLISENIGIGLEMLSSLNIVSISAILCARPITTTNNNIHAFHDRCICRCNIRS